MSVHPHRTNDDPPTGGSAVSGRRDGLDGDAVEALVVAHQGAVRGFLGYLGCPRSHVDDLVQETFLTFLSARFEERDARATARYLRSIARHLFLKSLRRLDRDPPAIDLDAAESVWAEFQDDGGGAPYLDALRRCLSGVTGRARDALELRYAGDLGRAAIARRLELSESGVHSILVRARRRLRECVERRLGA
ncbi:MAG: sigma-70 family RNA polymerase sigma factor [Planctomycetota bacterium]